MGIQNPASLGSNKFVRLHREKYSFSPSRRGQSHSPRTSKKSTRPAPSMNSSPASPAFPSIEADLDGGRCHVDLCSADEKLYHVDLCEPEVVNRFAPVDMRADERDVMEKTRSESSSIYKRRLKSNRPYRAKTLPPRRMAEAVAAASELVPMTAAGEE